MYEQPLSVITRAVRLADRDANATSEPREEQRALNLRARDRRRVRERAQATTANGEWQRVATFLGNAGAHGAERLGHPAHRSLPQGGVARERGRKALPGEDAQHQPGGGAGVAAVQR